MEVCQLKADLAWGSSEGNEKQGPLNRGLTIIVDGAHQQCRMFKWCTFHKRPHSLVGRDQELRPRQIEHLLQPEEHCKEEKQGPCYNGHYDSFFSPPA
jgi:hypothetical protein